MHSCRSGVEVSRMYSCVLELLGDLSEKGQCDGTSKDRASGQGEDHARTRADLVWGWQSRLGLGAEQGHIWQNRIHAGHPYHKPKTGLYWSKVRVVQDVT